MSEHPAKIQVEAQHYQKHVASLESRQKHTSSRNPKYQINDPKDGRNSYLQKWLFFGNTHIPSKIIFTRAEND